MPPLKDVTTMITAARSRAMRFTMIIQNFAQLNEVYGEQNAETIKGNCGNTIYLISTELKALKEISEMCGDIKVKTGKKDAEGKDIEETRPLITISDLQKMKMNEVIVRRIRLAPFKTKLTPEWQMQWEHKYKQALVINIPQRERREVKMFNVKDYVKEKKGASNPFGGMPNPFGGNPFGGMSSSPFPGLFDGPPSIPSNNNNSKIDVDKILANLDAKIAEIEAEEKRLAEEEKNEQQQNNKVEEKPNNLLPENNVVNDEKISEADIVTNLPIKDVLPKIDNDFKPITEPKDFTKEEDLGNVTDIVDKIKTTTNNLSNQNNQANLQESNDNNTVYKEVSDDEFFDDFFDE